MTLEAILGAAREMDLLVHNLFEREDGQWQANVRERREDAKHDLHHQFAVAAYPRDALVEAINIAVERRRK